MDAFDADVLIYAGTPGHLLGQTVEQLFQTQPVDEIPVGLGSVLLLPEVLTKPTRDGDQAGLARLIALLGRLALRPVDQDIGDLSVVLAAQYRLKAADAIHLATAAHAGADRFITNNRGEFPKTITEVAVTYPDEL